jgi:hypothetical protein
MNTKKNTRFMIELALVVFAVGLSGCGRGNEVPVIEVTSPPVETITFQNGDVTLAGTLDLTVGEGPFPAIVTVHGSPPLTRNDIYNLRISHFFIQHGYAVLRYDKRGAGESEGEYPDVGTHENGEANLNILADDALAGIAFLKNHDLIDPERIGLAGHSQAGWIIPLAASKSPDVAFMIISSGPTSTVGQEIYFSDLTEEGNALQDASDLARDFAGPHGFDPLPSLQELDIPGLWLLGAQDRSIPTPLTIEILDSLIADHDKAFTYIIYPNKGHGWRDVDNGQVYPVLNDALDWLDEKFGG